MNLGITNCITVSDQATHWARWSAVIVLEGLLFTLMVWLTFHLSRSLLLTRPTYISSVIWVIVTRASLREYILHTNSWKKGHIVVTIRSVPDVRKMSASCSQQQQCYLLGYLKQISWAHQSLRACRKRPVYALGSPIARLLSVTLRLRRCEQSSLMLLCAILRSL